MEKLEKVIKGLEYCAASCKGAWDEENGCLYMADWIHILMHEKGKNGRCVDLLAADALELLKAREPSDDWISRKRLKNEIQYYIDEAGWGEEINKALGWCLEFIDNQEAVKRE